VSGEGEESNGIGARDTSWRVCSAEPGVDGRAHFRGLRGLSNRSNSGPERVPHGDRYSRLYAHPGASQAQPERVPRGDRYSKRHHCAHVAGASHESEDQFTPGWVSATRVEPAFAVAWLLGARRPVG
jgi:hypothetical protein